MSIKKTVEIEAIAKDAIEQIQSLTAKVEGLEQSLVDAGKETKKTNKILGGLSNLLKGGLGLAVIQKGFDLLKETFLANQKVADLFATGMETLSLVFNQVVDAVVRGNGQFNALGSVLTNVINIGLAPFKLAIEGITLGFKSAQLAFAQFTGASETEISKLKSEIVETTENIKGIGSGVIDSGKAIVENFGSAVDSIKNISVTAAYEQAKQNVQLQKAAELAEAQNRIILEQKDREAEKLRQIRDDESKTIEERIEANNKLAAVLDEQERLMLANADAAIKAAQAQFDKNKNQENQIALLQAQAEREGILAQIEGFRSEQLMNINSLERERVDLLEEAKEKELEYYSEQAELAIKAQEEKKKQAEEEIKLAEAVRVAKINDATNTLNDITALAGEGSAIGRAAAVTSATISGIEGVQNAYSTAQKSPITAIFPAYPIIQAGLAAAFSATQIKSILSTPKPNKSGGSIRSPRVSGGAASPAPPQAPSFNVVGASPENQLAQVIGEQDKQPVRAYVVSNEVTNAQALDRNIVESASLG